MLLLLLVAAWSLAGSARADCDACVDGWCHSQKTLIEGFHVTDQLAIDHTHNVLYVQLNSNLNSAFFLDDLKIKLVKLMNTSGMTVDQATQDLYVADYNRNIYKFKYGSNTSELYSVNKYEPDVELLFFKGDLYYTSRHVSSNSGLNYINNDGKYKFYSRRRTTNDERRTNDLNLTVTDFVVNKDRKVYFVANDKVYVCLSSRFFSKGVTKVVTEKSYVLSTDKPGNVYLGDDKVRAIYKLNEADELVEYAAYKTGSVDKFVFDKDNNIVFHDAVNRNVLTWKKELTKCKIHAPHTHFLIEELSSLLEINEEAQ